MALSDYMLRKISETQRLLNSRPNSYCTLRGDYAKAAEKLVLIGVAQRHPEQPGMYILK